MKQPYNPNILTYTISFEAYDKQDLLITSGSVNFYVSNNQDHKQELKRQTLSYFSWYENFNNLQVKIMTITKDIPEIEQRLGNLFNF
jgi:hypothetical protein